MSEKANVRDFLSKEEIKDLRAASNLKALSMFLFNWALIGAAFVLVAWDANVLTILCALCILGGRQLGLGILLHECAHRSFFSSQRLNDVVGHWFAGLAIFVPIDFYRPYHFKHHTRTGHEDDPDVGNIAQYPVSPASFKRKMLRDFLGLSGLKSTMALFLYVLPGRAGNAVSLGINPEDIGRNAGWSMGLKNMSQVLVFHGAFFALLWLSGQPWLYGLWWLAYLTTHPFIIRVRQIAEHGAMPQLHSDDVRLTTRTTMARWWERLLFAPNFVNYHCEHHLMPTVPSYRLPQMHALLKQRGFYRSREAALVEGGYPEVIRLAASA